MSIRICETNDVVLLTGHDCQLALLSFVHSCRSPVLIQSHSTQPRTGCPAIALEDCKTMRAAFGRCSRLLHSASEVLNPPPPAPSAIQAEIDTLRNWVA